MNKLLIFLFGMLVIYASSTCQNSTTQETIGEAMLVQLGTDAASYVKFAVDHLEDESGNVYEIGRLDYSPKTFVRKLDSDGVEQWSGYYDGLYVTSKSSTLDSTGAYLRLCGFASSDYIKYLEIDTSDGSVNAQTDTNDNLFFVNSNPDMVQCGFSPSADYLFVIGIRNDPEVHLMRYDLTDLSLDFTTAKIETDYADYYPLSHAGMDDTHVIATAIVGDAVSKDSIGIFKFGWASPPTRDWGIKIMNNINSTDQTTRLLLNSDQTQAIVSFITENDGVIIHMLTTSDGVAVRQGKITGSPVQIVEITSMSLVDDSTTTDNILYILIQKTGADSPLSRINLTTMTGTTYTTYVTAFDYVYSLSAQLSNDLIYISGTYDTGKQYGVIKVNPTMPFVLESFIAVDTAFTISLISDTSYPDSEHLLANIASPGSDISTNSPGDITFNDETSTESDVVTITLNIWASATNSSITPAASGNLTTEYTCINYEGTGPFTEQALTYSLDDGDGAEPSWITIDSETAEMTYVAPDEDITYNYILRGTSSDGDVYDTSLTIIVGAGSGSSGLSIYGGMAAIIIPLILLLLVE